MKRKVENWTVSKLLRQRTAIFFPEYQREPNLWSPAKKSLLIDSILVDIDIPKLYFNRAEHGYEVVDGQQRLWAIWGYLDDAYPYRANGKAQKFSQLSKVQRRTILDYELQVTVLQNATDQYLRELFLRLQLGLLLLTGEKLHAASGNMKEFVFRRLASHKFIAGLGIPKRRYAKETLCAQIAINSFTRAKLGEFARTRYEDLIEFLKEYEQPRGADAAFFKSQSQKVLNVLDSLGASFGARARELKNRSYTLSVYLLFESLGGISKNESKRIVDFVFALWRRLKEEAKAGFDRKNRELYAFETFLSSAPGEKYQIERRHEKFIEFYRHFKRTGKMKGD